MAENQDGQEKSEEPTQRRVSDARQKGQVPRSRELNTLIMMVMSAAGLLVLGPKLMSDLLAVLQEGFSLPREYIFDTKYMMLLLQARFADGIWLMAPFLLLLTVIALAASLLVGGWNFSVEALAFKGSKLDPIKGTKRIFGVHGLIELIKALFKVEFVGGAAVLVLFWYADEMLALGVMPMEVAMQHLGDMVLWCFLAMGASLLIVAVIDAPFQLWNNNRQLKMSKDEVRREHKQQEGSPEVKGRIRRLQIEMAQRRMMNKIPEADVVITNPTHYAIALKYDKNAGGAPVVVAKGCDEIAARIRDIASQHNVPMLSSPALARAIYFSTELDHEIPAGLYVAVAKVLAYIFSLREKPGTDFSKPLQYDDVVIPEEFRRDA